MGFRPFIRGTGLTTWLETFDLRGDLFDSSSSSMIFSKPLLILNYVNHRHKKY